MKHVREPLFPWYGYVAINAIVWVLTIGAYVLVVSGRVSTPGATVGRPGVAAWLMFIPLAFLIASLYDALVDRINARSRARRAQNRANAGDDDRRADD